MLRSADPPQVSKFGDGFALLVLELCRKVWCGDRCYWLPCCWWQKCVLCAVVVAIPFLPAIVSLPSMPLSFPLS